MDRIKKSTNSTIKESNQESSNGDATKNDAGKRKKQEEPLDLDDDDVFGVSLKEKERKNSRKMKYVIHSISTFLHIFLICS
jgi:hypothetical protein